MTLSGTRNPKAATCEDVDEETQTIKSDLHTPANVSKKRSQSSDLNRKSTADKQSQNGSDSGYSSKTGTNESLASGSKMSTDLAAKTNVMDRPSQPYSYTPANNKPPVRPTIKVDTVKEKSPKKEKRYRHPPEDNCYTCNLVGYHCELSELPPQYAPPKSPKSSHKAKSTTEKPKTRRQSSHIRERPTSMYAVPTQPQVFVSPFYIEAPVAFSQYPGPLTPITPSPYPQPFQYPYETRTPISAAPHECQECADAYHNYPPTPQYAEQPVITYTPHYEPSQFHPHHRRPSHELERPHLDHVQHRSAISKSSKAQLDRITMPPPTGKMPRRTSMDPGHIETRRPSVHHEHEDRPRLASKRASRDLSTNGFLPPSAWKGSGEAAERPKNRKTASYSETSAESAAHAHRESLHRRVTDPVEEKAAQVEAYLAKSNKSGGLTAETLKNLDKHRTSPSETGTARSKSSARGKRSSTVLSSSGCTNIIVDGLHLTIPQDNTGQEFNLTVGNFTVSGGGDRDAAQQKIKERKQLERVPSNASRETRPQPPDTGVTDEPQSSRRTSRTSDSPDKTKISRNSSKRSSRAPSKVDAEGERVRTRDHPEHLEDFYGA